MNHLTELVRVFAQQLADYALMNPEQTATLVAAVFGIAFNYQRTGKFPIGRVPWRYLRMAVSDLGDQYFGTSRPKGVPALVVQAPPEQVQYDLRKRHYESSDLYSYEYSGERFGMRRPSGLRRHPASGDDVPMETHGRGFLTTQDETLVVAHDEASRFEATGYHLDESLMSWERGRDILKDDLTALGYEPEAIESERDAGIEVVPK